MMPREGGRERGGGRPSKSGVILHQSLRPSPERKGESGWEGGRAKQREREKRERDKERDTERETRR